MRSQAEPTTRKLKSNRSRRMVYQFRSLKNGRPVKVEEWIELHYCYLLEFDEFVTLYLAQPSLFEAIVDGKVHRYRSDFEVRRAGAALPVYVECKPEKTLESFARTARELRRLRSL